MSIQYEIHTLNMPAQNLLLVFFSSIVWIIFFGIHGAMLESNIKYENSLVFFSFSVFLNKNCMSFDCNVCNRDLHSYLLVCYHYCYCFFFCLPLKSHYFEYYKIKFDAKLARFYYCYYYCLCFILFFLYLNWLVVSFFSLSASDV